MCRIMYDEQGCAVCEKIVRFPEMCRIMYDSQGCARFAELCMMYEGVQGVQKSVCTEVFKMMHGHDVHFVQVQGCSMFME
jgi:hypothetical protein